MLSSLRRAKAAVYASLFQIDIVPIECNNGHAQRYARVRSTHVTPCDAVFASTASCIDAERQQVRHHGLTPVAPAIMDVDYDGDAEKAAAPEAVKAKRKVLKNRYKEMGLVHICFRGMPGRLEQEEAKRKLAGSLETLQIWRDPG